MLNLCLRALPQKKYRLGEPIAVLFELANNYTNQSFRILKWGTVFDAFVENALRVKSLELNSFLPYEGYIAKRVQPIEESYITVLPGKTISITLDLSNYFSIKQQGKYEIQLSNTLTDAFSLTQGTPSIHRVSDFKSEVIHVENAIFEIFGEGNPKSTIREIESNELGRRRVSRGVSTGNTVQAPAVELELDMEKVSTDTEIAHYEVYKCINKCISELEYMLKSRDVTDHYTKMFGKVNRDFRSDIMRVITVKNNFTKLKEYMETTTLWYTYSCMQEYQDAYAYVTGNIPMIHLCNSYIQNTKLSGEDSKIGTILHELTHVVLGTKDVHEDYTDKDGKPVKIYGREICEKLARTKPELAIKTADCYEFFLETQYAFWQGDRELIALDSLKQLQIIKLLEQQEIGPLVQFDAKVHPKSNHAPSLISYKKLLYCFYSGDFGNDIRYSTHTNYQWFFDKSIPKDGIFDLSLYTPYAPGVTIYQDKITLVFRLLNSSDIYYLQGDGIKWSKSSPIKLQNKKNASPRSSHNPSAVTYQNKVYIVYKGHDVDDLYYAYYDGKNWGGDHKIVISSRTPKSKYSPGIAVHNDRLYIVYKGARPDNYGLYYAWFDGSSWYGDEKIADIADIAPKSRYSPCLAAAGGMVYMTYVGYKDDKIWQVQFNYDEKLKRLVFTGDESIDSNSNISPRTNNTPSIGVHLDHVYTVFKSNKDSSLWWGYKHQ